MWPSSFSVSDFYHKHWFVVKGVSISILTLLNPMKMNNHDQPLLLIENHESDRSWSLEVNDGSQATSASTSPNTHYMTVVVKELRILNTSMIDLNTSMIGLNDKMDRIATTSMASMVCSIAAASVVSVGLQSIFKNSLIFFRRCFAWWNCPPNELPRGLLWTMVVQKTFFFSFFCFLFLFDSRQ